MPELRIDELRWKRLQLLAEAAGVSPEELVGRFIDAVTRDPFPVVAGMAGLGTVSLLGALTPAAVAAIEHGLVRGFTRLLKRMHVEHVECIPKPGSGCSSPAGFRMELRGRGGDTPLYLKFSIAHVSDEAVSVVLDACIAPGEYAQEYLLEKWSMEEKVRYATSAALRAIRYIEPRGRKGLERLTDYLEKEAGVYWYEAHMRPGRSTDKGVPTIELHVEALGPPGRMLPFNMNLVISVIEYSARRLERSYGVVLRDLVNKRRGFRFRGRPLKKPGRPGAVIVGCCGYYFAILEGMEITEEGEVIKYAEDVPTS